MNKSVHKSILLVLLFALMPFAINFTNFVAKDIHDLMIFSYSLLYIFAFISIVKLKIKFTTFAYVCALTVCCIHWCIFSNTVMLKKQFEYDKTMANVNRIIQRIEHLDNFDPAKDTIYLEPLVQSSYLNNPLNSLFVEYSINQTGLNDSLSVTYDMQQFFKFFELGFRIKTLDDNTFASDVLKLVDKQTVNNMKAYPDKTSVYKSGNIVIVKMTDKTY